MTDEQRRAKVAERKRAYYQANKDRAAEYMRAYRQANTEYQRAKRQENKATLWEKRRAARRAKFALMRQQLRSPLIVPIGKRTGAKRLIAKNVRTPSTTPGRYVRVRGERKFVGNQALSPTARAHVRA